MVRTHHGSSQRQRRTTTTQEIDIAAGGLTPPSPLPSPFVGPSKGNRRKNKAMESPYQKLHKRAFSADIALEAAELGLDQMMVVPNYGSNNNSNHTNTVEFTFQRNIKGRGRSDDDDDNDSNNATGGCDYDDSAPLISTYSRTRDRDNNNNNDEDDDDDDNQTSAVHTFLEQTLTDGTAAVTAAVEYVGEAAQEAWADYEDKRHYDWRNFYRGDGGIANFLSFLATGTSRGCKQTDDEIQENLNSLARMISLLRDYQERFGMPERGGPKDQEYVLREVTKDLYAGGSPIWALEPIMKKVAEGLTGKRGVDFFMLPRRTFIIAPSSGATTMFRITRGYDMQRLDDMEAVAVKLASYASNTSNSASSIPVRWPQPQELRRAYRNDSVNGSVGNNNENNDDDDNGKYSQEEMAEEILGLAAEAEGLFFFLNSHHDRAAFRKEGVHDQTTTEAQSELSEFWKVDDTTRELFSRLAALEAVTAIDQLDVERKRLYSKHTVTLFRIGASASACAFWFNGSWIDVFVSGALAVLVASIGSSPILSKQERIIFESVASFAVGLVAALISLTWPTHTCFGAMAISGILDLLQGFRVVYSIIEIMSRHTVAGGADFLEGIFFTTLIAYFLRFGSLTAIQILGEPETQAFMICDKGVDHQWYWFVVPFGAFCWSGLFNPYYLDLPFMAAHGVLGYVVSWQFYKTTSQFNNFMAAMCVTFSAGVISRFTGRQALGNTVAGLYVLLPGAYLVNEVFTDRVEGFLTSIIMRAIIIGIGAWTGTILCSPTLIGMNKGLVNHAPGMPVLLAQANNYPSDGSMASSVGESMATLPNSGNFRRRDKGVRKNGTGALLFF